MLGGPVEFIGPDPVPGDVRVVALFEHGLQGVEVGLVQPGVVQGLGPLLDPLVVVDVLANIEIHLPVLVVEGDELARDSPDHVVDDRSDGRLQEKGVHFRQARRQ